MTVSNPHIVVVGAGFKGLAACTHLRAAGAKVTLLDAAPAFGGVMRSRLEGGFYVDNGVQVFEFISEEVAALVEDIMEGEVRTIDSLRASSALAGEVTEGFTLPDLRGLPQATRDRITGELVGLASAPPTDTAPGSLAELFDTRYGETAGALFKGFIARIYSADAADLHPSSTSSTALVRLKHLSDAEMLVLKAHPDLDRRLAATRRAMGAVEGVISRYPGGGRGMLGFCERAEAWLTAQGVEQHYGARISALTPQPDGVEIGFGDQSLAADGLVWATDALTPLAKTIGLSVEIDSLLHGAPMVRYCFTVEADSVQDLLYRHIFDEEATSYRIAAAGAYSGQVTPEGLTFVTCECPAVVEGPLWREAETPERIAAVWEECRAYGVITGDAGHRDVNISKSPVTNRLQRVGYPEAVERLVASLEEGMPRIRVAAPGIFGRQTMFDQTRDLTRDLLAAV